MEFKDILRKLRTEKGDTVNHLATVLKKSDSAIRMWETGKAKPDADTLIELSTYFSCNADYLLGLQDYKTLENEDIGNLLGLSDRAIENIRNIKKSITNTNGAYLVVLNDLLESHMLSDLLFEIGEHLYEVKNAPYFWKHIRKTYDDLPADEKEKNTLRYNSESEYCKGVTTIGRLAITDVLLNIIKELEGDTNATQN